MKTSFAGYLRKQTHQSYGMQLTVVLFYLTQHLLDWPLLKSSRMRGEFNFQDFVTIFKSAECFQTIGLQIYEPDQSRPLCFYPYGRSFIYLIDLLRIPATWAPALIIFVSLMILNITARFLQNPTVFEKIVFVVFFVSPPMWLGFERGNADLLICLLVLFSAYYASINRETLAIWILIVTVLIKFYTFPLLVFYLWSRKGTANRWIVSSLMACLVYVMFIDIQAQKLQQPGSFAFGTPIVTFWLNALNSNLSLGFSEVSIRVGQLIGLLFLAIITLYFVKHIPLENSMRTQENSRTNFGVVFLGIVYVSCFALGMNYDYRLVFSVIAGLLLLASNVDLGYSKRVLFSVWFFSLWLSVFSFGLEPRMHLLIQWLGNVFDFLTAGFLAALIINQYFTRFAVVRKLRKIQNA